MEKKSFRRHRKNYKNYQILNKFLELLIVSLRFHKTKHFSDGVTINLVKLPEQQENPLFQFHKV